MNAETAVATEPTEGSLVAAAEEADATAIEPGLASKGFPRGLVFAPFALAALAYGVVWNIDSSELDSSEISALQWSTKLLPQLREHLSLTGWSTLWVLLIAVPLGIILTRPAFRKYSGAFLAVASSGQAVPAYGLFVIIYMWQGTGPRSSIIALVIFTLLPVLRNTMVGLDQVSAEVIESARGMGLTKFGALRSIELPLAVPVILAGVRTALVINVGMAALATFTGGGGLGTTIIVGLKLNRPLITFTGASLTALLALSIDWLAALVERMLRPRGL